MENIQTVSQLNTVVWFSYFSQSFYFSFGYFAFPKTEYEADCLEDLGNAGLI